MLRLTEVEFTNFGPFRGTQVLTFPHDDGVTVVYGENMRGKTTLLNGLRFALFGIVRGRNRQQGSLAKLPNFDEAKLGNFDFGVTLRFENDGRRYELTRSCTPRVKGSEPTTDAEFLVNLFLTRDGDVLGPGEAEAELHRVMPEQISRFFLFDGELLQEYEELLSTESDMGRKISEAIESVLGVPVLTDARAGLAGLKKDFERREARAARADTMNAQLGAALAAKIEERDVLEQEVDKYKQEIEERKGERSSLEDSLRKQERFISLLDKRDALQRRVDELDRASKAKRDQIAARMGDAWRPLVQARARVALDGLRSEEKELERHEIQRDTLEALGAGGTSECPACLQPISVEARDRLRETVDRSKPQAQAEHERLLDLRGMTASLDRLDRNDQGDLLKMLWSDLRGLEQERYVAGEDIKELNSDLQNADEASVRQLQSQSDAILKDIAILESGVQQTSERLDAVRRDIGGLRDKLAAQGGSSLERERHMLNLADQIYRLFDAGVSVYRERLRERVEADATDLFRRLTTEPEFVSLQINEGYGLSIMHADGEIVTVRSAGAEHVVALCLMGALQKNAPLRGPIVIDSPFGRLDHKHTENIVRALPVMAPEVVLLVYEDELRPELARQFLGTSLRAEYKLTRVSARHTDLEKVV